MMRVFPPVLLGITGPKDARLDQQGGPGEKRPGAAGGDKGIRLAVGQHFEAYNHGGILSFVDHSSGVIVHIHHIVCMGDLQSFGQVLNLVLAHDPQNLLPTAHQGDFCTEIPMGLQCAQNRGLRGQVAAHGVENDFHGDTSFLYIPF